MSKRKAPDAAQTSAPAAAAASASAAAAARDVDHKVHSTAGGGTSRDVPYGDTCVQPVTSPEALYGGRISDSARTRLAALVQAFYAEFGPEVHADADRPFVVRAPGRVNLIGEHIDYSDFGVLPIAIEQDVLLCVRAVPLDTTDPKAVRQLRLRNTDAHRFPPRDIPLPSSGAAADVAIDKANLHWTHYFLCGYRGMCEHLQLRAGALKTLQVLVCGRIPPAAGLSSSSAFVVASALATHHALLRHMALQLAVSRSTLANLCARAERFVGTEGGGMDQAISVLATPGVAQHIRFHPLQADAVRLPPGGVWVVTHTLVEAHKQVDGQRHFNRRVVECRLACASLTKLLTDRAPHTLLPPPTTGTAAAVASE